MPHKSKKNVKGATGPEEERKNVVKSDGEEYALVVKKLGSGRFMVKINLRSTQVIGRICGSLRHGKGKRNNFVDEGSLVLVGLRSFQDNVVDILYVYQPAEVRILIKTGAYIEETDRAFAIAQEEEPGGFDFDNL